MAVKTGIDFIDMFWLDYIFSPKTRFCVYYGSQVHGCAFEHAQGLIHAQFRVDNHAAHFRRRVMEEKGSIMTLEGATYLHVMILRGLVGNNSLAAMMDHQLTCTMNGQSWPSNIMLHAIGRQGGSVAKPVVFSRNVQIPRLHVSELFAQIGKHLAGTRS